MAVKNQNYSKEAEALLEKARRDFPKMGEAERHTTWLQIMQRFLESDQEFFELELLVIGSKGDKMLETILEQLDWAMLLMQNKSQ